MKTCNWSNRSLIHQVRELKSFDRVSYYPNTLVLHHLPQKSIVKLMSLTMNTDASPELHSLFLLFNDQYFGGLLGSVEVKWSNRMTLCAGMCYYYPGGWTTFEFDLIFKSNEINCIILIWIHHHHHLHLHHHLHHHLHFHQFRLLQR